MQLRARRAPQRPQRAGTGRGDAAAPLDRRRGRARSRTRCWRRRRAGPTRATGTTSQLGDVIDTVTKGPIGLTDEVAFVAARRHADPAAERARGLAARVRRHPAWAFRDPITRRWNRSTRALQRPGCPRHGRRDVSTTSGSNGSAGTSTILTDWMGDDAWIKTARAEYRSFVYLSDVVRLGGDVLEQVGRRRRRARGRRCSTFARNQRGDDVMPGTATIALPVRSETGSPAGRRARVRHGEQPSLEDFRREAERGWPGAVHPPAADGGRRFVWGDGRTRSASSRSRTPRSRPTRCPRSAVAPEVWDAGYGWIDWSDRVRRPWPARCVPPRLRRADPRLRRAGDGALTDRTGHDRPDDPAARQRGQKPGLLPALYSGDRSRVSCSASPGPARTLPPSHPCRPRR